MRKQSALRNNSSLHFFAEIFSVVSKMQNVIHGILFDFLTLRASRVKSLSFRIKSLPFQVKPHCGMQQAKLITAPVKSALKPAYSGFLA
ncbi:hypothetical protein [Desulfoluna sp.]|uniref:hypothetical protein n=1 Tax=Desulfoluna sp. TaxID=2045199 RepID=UPI002636AA6D|nr:hypothetical protein [Desulfoluna sp.]